MPRGSRKHCGLLPGTGFWGERRNRGREFGAPRAMVRDVAGFYADRRFSRGYSTGMNTVFHRLCPPDVRSRLAWHDRALWPLVADDAYRGRHEKKAAKSGGDGVDVSSLYPLCG